MKRNPIYVFEDLTSIGIYGTPVGASIQVNSVDATDIPKTFKLRGKIGVIISTTMGQFLDGDPSNYVDLNQATEIPSELEKIEQSSGTGWRMLGRNANSYQSIGHNAIDMSYSDCVNVGCGVFGAGGAYSVATGFKTIVNSYGGFAAGIQTISNTRGGFALGKYNVGLSDVNLLEVGCGSTATDRLNAIEVKDDGCVSAPQLTIAKIDASCDKILVTKEYSNAGIEAKYDKAGGIISGDVIIEGNTPLTDALTVNGSSLFKKEVVLDKTLTLGLNGLQNSALLFKDTSGLFPSLTWNNSLKDFYLDTDTLYNLRLWHSGNDGKDSVLDAGYLGGKKWTEYSTNQDLLDGLDGKYDKTGGIISGDIVASQDFTTLGHTIINTLTSQGTTTFAGIVSFNNNTIFNDDAQFNANVYLPSINSSVTFKEFATFEKSVTMLSELNVLGLNVTMDSVRNSIIEFEDANPLLEIPKIFWSTDLNAFMINTREQGTNGGPFKLWHEGNFSANSNVSNFTDLGDTPSTYAGAYGRLLQVNLAEDGLEFVAGNTQAAEWGHINGALANQTDLAAILSDTVRLNTGNVQTISNSLTIGLDCLIGNNLTVDGDIEIGVGSLSVSDIVTPVSFASNIQVSGNIIGDSVIQSNTSFKVGLISTDIEGIPTINSRVDFTAAAGAINPNPAIYFDTVTDQFKVSDGTGTNRPIKLDDAGGATGYAELGSANLFTETNTFEKDIVLSGILGITTPELDVQGAFITIGERDPEILGEAWNGRLEAGFTTEQLTFIAGTQNDPLLPAYDPDYTDPTGLFASLYWDSSQFEWTVDTVFINNPDLPGDPGYDPLNDFLDTNTGARLWHDANFSPSTKLDKVGGLIQGNLIIAENVANGENGDLTVAGDLNVAGDLTYNNTTMNNLTAKGDVHFSATSPGSQTFVVDNDISTEIQSDTVVMNATDINFSGLPTTDPGVPGQLWDDNGFMMISQ